MTYSLAPRYRLLANVGQDRGYVIAPTGRYSEVNVDAIDLLGATDTSWQADPDYADFLASAIEAGWLRQATGGPAPRTRRFSSEHHLQRIQYEINLLCNLECAHCYCSSSPHADRGKPTEFVKDLVSQAARMGTIYFDITGGEPLARPDLFEILGHISDSGMIPGLFTNCTLVDAGVAQRLAACGVASVQTSLDAATPALHDDFRGRKGAFRKAVAGIRALKNTGIAVSVTIAVNRRNAHELGQLCDFLTHDLVVPYRVDRVIPSGRGLENADSIALSNAEFYRLTREVCGGYDVQLAKVCDSPALASSADRIDPACGVGVSYMFIKHDGRAALCPTMTEAESPEFRQADLSSLTLEDAWLRHPTFQAYRHVQCRNAATCPTGSHCGGGCRSNAYLLHGSADSPDELSCNVFKNDTGVYEEFLELYRSGATRNPARRHLPVLRG